MAVRKVLDAVANATNARDVKLRIMDQVPELFGEGAIGLYMFGADQAVTEVHTRGVRDGFILTYEQMGRGHDPILERALRTGEATHDGTVYPGDEWRQSRLYRECGGPWLIRHYMCAPIVAGGKLIGTLNLGRRSEAHPFGAKETAGVAAICRAIAARLCALDEPRDRDGGGDGDAGAGESGPTIEELGRLRAEQVRLRMHAAELEARARTLGGDEAAALWDEVASGRVAPLDLFDHGDRTYVLLPARQGAPVAPRRPLTRRESEVVRRAAAGLANKEIAFELGISLNTVGSALRAARDKLGVASRVKLVETARRLGLD